MIWFLDRFGFIIAFHYIIIKWLFPLLYNIKHIKTYFFNFYIIIIIIAVKEYSIDN